MESVSEIKTQTKSTGTTNERSTIDFPYTDLDNAVEVVRGVHSAGGNACDNDQLAAQLALEAKGGGFRLRLNGAKTFGLLTYERGGRINLTDVGRRLLDAAQERQARVDAFLNVPLYVKVYEQYKGGPLPPQAGLERSLVAMGVGDGVKDKARQVMLRSAKQAGFFDMAGDRLIKPSIKPENKQNENTPQGSEEDNAGLVGKNGGGGGGSYHPLIQGLLMTLPKPGESWNKKERSNWLILANSTFNLIYKSDGDEGEIEIKVTHKTQ